jgi:hypothetical protein
MLNRIKRDLIIGFLAVAAAGILMLFSSCTSDAPRIHTAGNRTVVQTDKRFLGLKVYTAQREVKSKKEQEQEIEISRKKAQAALATWAGAALLGWAIVSVILGYLTRGWKFWAGMAAVSGTLGLIVWSLSHWLPYLKWAIVVVVVVGIAKTLHGTKDFSLKRWFQERKA